MALIRELPVKHDFRESLSKSERDARDPLWGIVYAQYFVDFMSMEYVTDKAQQRRGIDRIITLKNNVKVTVDKKLREPQYWGDVFVETVSVDTTGAPGWALKSLDCDYMAYAFRASKVCYIWPFHAVRRAWEANAERWTRQYPNKGAANVGYKTRGVIVPLGPWLQAIQNAEWVSWESNDQLPFDPPLAQRKMGGY